MSIRFPANPKHRWPKSVHSQLEAILHQIRSFGMSKKMGNGLIRSVGTWQAYRREMHRFTDYYITIGGNDLLDVSNLTSAVNGYLSKLLSDAEHKNLSRQTFKVTLAAFARLEEAHRSYVYHHMVVADDLNLIDILDNYRNESRRRLSRTSSQYNRRGYDDPLALMKAIKAPAMQLMAKLQYEGGLRSEGVGAPSGNLSNPVTQSSLGGYFCDPVSRETVGIVCVREKGGKRTEHFISVDTYEQLVLFLQANQKLEVSYTSYLNEINKAAITTGQYEPSRGTHGLKHNFAEERYHQAVQEGMSHEQAMQQVSLETSHFRMRETMTYTRGK